MPLPENGSRSLSGAATLRNFLSLTEKVLNDPFPNPYRRLGAMVSSIRVRIDLRERFDLARGLLRKS